MRPPITIPHPWTWKKRSPAEMPPYIQGKLAYTESEILGGQIHQAVMYEPILSTIAGLIAFIVLVPTVPDGTPWLGDLLVLGFVAVVVRLVWRWVDWNRSLFFFTPYRIIYIHGILTRKIAMLPMGKVTDMRYDRTPAGTFLDYGMFVIESAGQEQALRELNYVPEPDQTYKQIVDWLFGKGTTNVNIVDVTMTQPNKSVPVSVRNWPPRDSRDGDDPGGSPAGSPGGKPWWKN
ncbi:MAG: hypothetical protein QG622_1390 [Actinomycetota bacterium]|nr:hypothetical protein [Actinomycetota bacterium]